MKNLPHIPVTSSNIESIAHDTDSKTLQVKFKNGGVYEYDGVDEAKFNALKGAPSIGSHLHQHIKGVHEHRKVG